MALLPGDRADAERRARDCAELGWAAPDVRRLIAVNYDCVRISNQELDEIVDASGAGPEATAPRVVERSESELLLDAAAMSMATKPSTSGASPSRLRTVRELLSGPEALELPPPVVPKIIWPARSTLLFAREKNGKSTFATQAAAAVARGREFLDAPACRGPVLWLAVEEHHNDVARRFAAHGVTDDGAEEIHVMNRSEGEPLADLETQARAVSPVLIVVDTLAAFAREANAEPGNASAWLPIVQGLTDIGRRTDAGMLLLHHARKSDGQYRDSTAIGAGVDVVVGMFEERVPTERRIEVKGRYSRETFTVNFEDGLYVPVGAGRTLPERITAYLRAAPDSSKSQVAKAIQGKRDDILKALDELVDRAVVEVREDGQAKRYRLPGEPVPSGDYRVWDREPVPEKSQSELGGNRSVSGPGTGSRTGSLKDSLKGDSDRDSEGSDPGNETGFEV